jgi:sec-independent protein translocase protein TatC
MVVYSYFFYEIKNRFFLLFLTGLSVILASYSYKEVLLFFICSNPQFSFIYTSITEVLSMYVKLISFITNQVILVYFFFHFLVFLAPGLYDKEYYLIKLVFRSSLFMFISSILFFNVVLFPLSCEFFLSFQDTIFKSLNIYFEAKIDDYFRFYTVLYHICCFYFQFFLFLVFLLYNLDKELKEIKLFRKLFYFLFSIISILVVPTDFLGQVLFCFILVFFYELLVFNFLLRRVSGIFYLFFKQANTENSQLPLL